MSVKSSQQKCVLMLIADGFIEIEAIGMLVALRSAHICSKIVGLTNGLINGAHGVLVMPDFTLADLEQVMGIQSVNMLILPGGERHLAGLEADPRVHRLLRQVIEQQGIITIDTWSTSWVTKTIGQQFEGQQCNQERIIVRDMFELPIEIFAQNLVRRLE